MAGEVSVHTSAAGLTSLELVGGVQKSLENYRAIVGDYLTDEVRSLADELKGIRLLHLSSTATGGGVAER